MSTREDLGAAIRARRNAAGLRLKDLRNQLRENGLSEGTSVSHLSEVERGSTWPSPNLVRALERVLKADGDLIWLLKEAKVPEASGVTSNESDHDVTAHLFYPLLVEALPQLQSGHRPTRFDFLPRVGCQVCASSVESVLHAFDFKVVVLHETHQVRVTDLVEVATWRREQIARAGTAVASYCERQGIALEPTDHEPYCFTGFVTVAGKAADVERQRRINELLAMPSVLTTADDRGRGVIGSSGPVGDIMDFSLMGSHYGSASWAAVAVALQDPRDPLGVVDALVQLEIQLQAFWCYASNVEAGERIPSELYDARYLSRIVAKLSCPWPKEHTATRRLREALIVTSRVKALVHSAVSAST